MIKNCDQTKFRNLGYSIHCTFGCYLCFGLPNAQHHQVVPALSVLFLVTYGIHERTKPLKNDRENFITMCVFSQYIVPLFFLLPHPKNLLGGFIKERMGKMPISILANVEKFHELKFCNTRSPNTAYLYKSRRSWIFQDLWHSGLRYEKKSQRR